MTSAIQVGSAANLFFGYRPVWNPNGDTKSPLFAPDNQPLSSVETESTPSDTPYWTGLPVITLHQSADSLVSTIYDYEVLPSAYHPEKVNIPSGPLSLNDADHASALEAASAFLGLDLKENSNYMLVAFTRLVSTQSAAPVDTPSDRLTAAAATIIDALAPAEEPENSDVLYDSKLSLNDAQDYMRAINQLGTHFVSSIRMGDIMFQVFSYDDDRFKIVKNQFDLEAKPLPNGQMAILGQQATSWSYWTTPADNYGNRGFVKEYGSLTTMSRDPALQKAIDEGKWQTSATPDGVPSIFAATEDSTLFLGVNQTVPCSIQLTPIADLLTNPWVRVPWERLVAGGMIQKYSNQIAIPLHGPIEYDWKEIFPQPTESWVSGIATPVIDVYQERIDLTDIQINAANVVAKQFPMKSFTCFSQVLQASPTSRSKELHIPSNNILFLSQIIDTTEAKTPPVLTMSEVGLEKLQIYCEDMYGALVFQSDTPTPPNRKTAIDGYLMESPHEVDPSTKRYGVELSGVLNETPPEQVLAAHTQSVEFSLLAGEALLQSHGPNADEVIGLEISYLNWLASIIPSNTTDLTLANVRARALYLSNAVATFGSTSTFVPYNRYDSYAKYVGDLVTQATYLDKKVTEMQMLMVQTTYHFQEMTSITAVNNNVRSIGEVLKKYFSVLVDGRRATDKFYDNYLEQLKSQLEQTQKNIASLALQLDAQQKRINHLGTPQGIIQRYEQDYADWESDQVFKCTMSLISGLFDLGVAVAGFPEEAEEGVVKALKAIGDIRDKLHSVIKVSEKLNALESTSSSLTELNALSNSIHDAALNGSMEMPSPTELSQLPGEIRVALQGVPDSETLQNDKEELIIATENLVTIGTALLTAQGQSSQLLIQIANTERLKRINADQQRSMDALVQAIGPGEETSQPDYSKIDLIGSTGQLQFQLKQVLSTLARVLENQNYSIEYTYFGKPAPISSFSLGNLLSVISMQDQNILTGVEKLQPQPQDIDTPISFKLNHVRAADLCDGKFLRVQVPVNDRAFANYAMVRINRVIAKVEGVVSTASGKYEIELDTQARPFADRNPHNRKIATFYGTRRAFGPYVYENGSNKIAFGDNVGKFDDMVNPLTPFAEWNVRFPVNEVNKDLKFDGLLVNVELEFHVSAIFNPPKAMLAHAPSNLLKAPVQSNRLATQSPSNATDDKLPATLSAMQQRMFDMQEVLNGWDAAFNTLVGPVNAFLNQQFYSYVSKLQPDDDSGFLKIDATYFSTVTKIPRTKNPVRYAANVTRMNFQVTNPLLRFIPGVSQATLQQFIRSGAIESGSIDVVTKVKTDGETAQPYSPFVPREGCIPDGPLEFKVDLKTNELVIAQTGVLSNYLGSIYLSTSAGGKLPSPLKIGDTDAYENEYYIVNCKTDEKANETRIQLSADLDGENVIKLENEGEGTFYLQVLVEWGESAKVELTHNPYILANVNLEQFRGVVSPPAGQGDIKDTLSVMINLKHGSFDIKNVHVKPDNWSSTGNEAEISEAIAGFFHRTDFSYEVQTINLKDLADIPALTPTSFRVNTLRTNQKNDVLQMLIMTSDAEQPSNLNIMVEEPVPYNSSGPVPGESDFMASLIISSQITFQHIFVESFNEKNSSDKSAGFKVKAEEEEGKKNWMAVTTAGTIQADVPFDNPYSVRGNSVKFRMSSSSDILNWSLIDMTFKPRTSHGVGLDYSNGNASTSTGGTTVKFQYSKLVSYSGYSQMHYYWTKWKDTSAMAYVTLSGNYELAISGDGIDQTIKFANREPNIVFSKSSDLKPNGPCDCSDLDSIKIQMLNALADEVPKALKQSMSQIDFTPMSVLALESLLFPGKQLINMSDASVPGDTLIVGQFLPQVRKKADKYNVTITASVGAHGEFNGKEFLNGNPDRDDVEDNSLPVSVSAKSQSATLKFKYGPIADGKAIPEYEVNIETGVIKPDSSGMFAIVYQPDIDGNPQDVSLLLPGYEVETKDK